ncbi:organic cation transporter protein isoform X1 [Phlebotomus argentipes]|uniref:organic cation transporter protein isoform X1 n=1 Tax=Phlebotomus argentipes TaxID=94469 RepID=UPI0028934631|nr:organic cation transporter protein isoform X1 [Phlebotomus argentipes]
MARRMSRVSFADYPLLNSGAAPGGVAANPSTQCRDTIDFEPVAPAPSHNIPYHPRRKSLIDEIDVPTENVDMVDKVDIIGKVVGDWGCFQLRTVLLIFLCKIPSAWFMSCIIFTAPAPRHGDFFCKPPPHLPIVPEVNKTQWIKISHPAVLDAADQELNIDFCNVYEDALDHVHKYFNRSDVSNPWIEPERNATNIIPCESFEHHSDYKSIITDFDLVCSRDILVATTQFFHLFGVLWGGIITTQLLVHFSPRRVMLAGMLSQIICGNLTGLVSSYGLHVFFRCLSAICCGLMYTAGAVIFSDITAGKYKTVVCTMFEQFWSIGVILLPGMASFVNNWSQLYMAISFPTFLLVILHRWIPDSPRWLIARNRITEAKAILEEAVRINGKQNALPRDLEHLLQVQAASCLEGPPPPNWWSLWEGHRAKRHMISIHLIWSIYIVTYYGMLLNIRVFGREHLEANTIVAGVCEIVGTFIGLYLILNTTRKWLWTGIWNVAAGIAACAIWLIPDSVQGIERVVLEMTTAMITKTAISTTLSILTTCTTELVSADKRRICAFSTIVWARIWLLTAPFIGATTIFGEYVAQTALSIMSVVGGFITMLISSPRTLPARKKKTNLPPELTTPEVWTVKGHQEKAEA